MTLESSYSQHIQSLQQGYEKVLDASPFDSVILHSGCGLRQRQCDDQYWPTKINPSFSHWAPLTQSRVMVLVRPGQKPKLIMPISDSFWEGKPKVESSHFWGEFERIDCSLDSVVSHLPAAKVAWIGDDIESANRFGIPTEAHNPPALLAAIEALRVLKSEYEVSCLREASRIATIGHAKTTELFLNGNHSELELHLAYLAATGQDATDTPYSNIVALGENAAILDLVLYGREKSERESTSMLVDAGATHMGYASDITRTVVRGASQAARDFAALIEGMNKLELAICEQVKPGLPYEEHHNLSHQALALLLLDSGICLGDASELVDRGVTRAFFPHGLGHSLGLQVHDVGCRLTDPSDENPFLRNTSTIAEGQVFTVEPGCYFIDGLLGPLKNTSAGELVSWSTVDALRPFGGIRIEDNLLVTANTCENLTRDNWPKQQ
ncbi:MAG: Xaa-Pro dipeptidase [Kofleriaceae bacterium]|nr:Xaa-Pro dipeptidase [Kofleriaceae bacterium]